MADAVFLELFLHLTKFLTGDNEVLSIRHLRKALTVSSNLKMTTNDILERIWLIADGIPLILDNMTIRTTDSNKLLVTGWTNTIHFENVTREKTLKELYDLKASYSELSKSFNELNDTVKSNNLMVEYHMAYDDSGKAGIGLCSEIEGKLNWYID